MQNVITDITNAMSGDLTPYQLQKLSNILQIKLVEPKTDIVTVETEWAAVLNLYLATKKLENCSDGTIANYGRCITMMMQEINKPLCDIGVNDLRYYLARYQQVRNISLSYLETLRHYIGSFFSWCADEEYIQSNPARRLNRVKVPVKIREPFTAEERERLKSSAKSQRDIALMEVLYSTAARVGEIVSLDRDNVDFTSRTVSLYGHKGKADRRVYLTEQAAYHLRLYLSERKDACSPLFVSNRAPHNRLTITGIQATLRKIGNRAGIHVHPHRFRRTLLTDAGIRGIPLQEIQRYAGHVKPDTTMLYVNVSDEHIKSSFTRLI